MNWYLDVIKKLNAEEVSYAIVGGFAVALHGASRGTIDLDLVITLDKKNLESFENSMKSLGLKSRIPVNAGDIYRFRKEYIEKKNLIAWSFQHPVHAHHVVDLIITHDFRKMKKVTKNLSGTPVALVALPDLIKMKRKSGRPQDIEDIKALESILKKSKK